MFNEIINIVGVGKIFATYSILNPQVGYFVYLSSTLKIYSTVFWLTLFLTTLEPVFSVSLNLRCVYSLSA